MKKEFNCYYNVYDFSEKGKKTIVYDSRPIWIEINDNEVFGMENDYQMMYKKDLELYDTIEEIKAKYPDAIDSDTYNEMDV